MKKGRILAILLVLLMLLASCSSNEVSPIKEEEDISSNQIPEFKASDLYGNTVTHEMFGDYSITMINIWGTFCGPCIQEMPELALLYDEIKETDLNLVGILVDVTEDENKELALQITEGNSASFTNIIPDEKLITYLTNNIAAVPTTIFVDNKGNIVGEPVVGARGKDDYMNILKQRLDMIDTEK